MLNGILTLFNWTLRMDQRSIWPHVIRGGFALFMMFALSTAWLDAFGTSRVGLRFFEAICYLNIVLITASGISYFVTALTEEKDAGTFALLQMAGMTPLAITLGKSTSRLVSSLLLLVAQLPFAFLAVTLGGLLWQQVIAAWLALAAWMVLVANVALLCSARCLTSGRATSVAGLITIAFFVLPPAVNGTLTAIPPGLLSPIVSTLLAGLANALESVSPFQRIDEILGNWGGTSFIGVQFWGSLVPGFVCFAISTLMLNRWTRASQDEGTSGVTAVRGWKPGRCRRFPVAWRDFHFFTGGYRFAAVKLVGGAVILGGFVVLQQLQTRQWSLVLRGDIAMQAFLAGVGWLTLEALLYASGSLFAEIRQSTQSTLAMLPISVNRLLLQKLLGCCVALIPAASWTLICMVLGWTTVRSILETDTVLAWVIMLLFGCHTAALLSLYTRWAALPLTLFFSFVAFFCLVLPILLIPDVVTAIAKTHGYRHSKLLAWGITCFWIWLIVVLPLQLGIRRRWLDLTRL